MAYQDDKYHRQAHHQEAWAHLLGYPVLDKDGGKIGTVKALWEDYTRQPAYLGISTSWLDMGRIHVVPAQFATLSERTQCLRLPFDADVIKDAPQCHATDEITLSGETKIRDYYYRKGIGTGWSHAQSEPASGHFREREERPARSPDWSARDRERREDEEHSRSFRERVRDAVDEGKAKLAGDHGHDPDRPEEYGRAEREMGLPFSDERPSGERPPLRKIYHETPVAEPVLPPDREAKARPREEDDFVPLRHEGMEYDRRRRDDDRDDLPLR
jgi:hypothetical protein